MPQVDFYILASDSLPARWEFVARLLGKLQTLGKTAHIAVDSAAEAEQLDALLWTFPPESFLPHCVVDSTASPDEPFTISAGACSTTVSAGTVSASAVSASTDSAGTVSASTDSASADATADFAESAGSLDGISTHVQLAANQDVFINLRRQPPAEHQQLQRLVEVVVQESTVLATTRQNFRFYREQGYAIQPHNIRL
jgi:DNA polymerase III subunit chi